MSKQAPRFKQSYVDFVVEEQLPYPLAKKGTRYYVQIEKRNMNTMDLVKKIMKQCNLTRKKIGIAGLKDKHALTRQRLCFHSNDVKKKGERAFLSDIDALCPVIQTGFSDIPLWLHSPIMNRFRVRLKYDHSQSSEQKKHLEQQFHTLCTEGFPNYFWEQRFWFSTVNHRIAQDILAGGRKHYTQAEKMFKLQAYSSRLFNNYIDHRLKIYKNIHLQDGDICLDTEHKLVLYREPDQVWTIHDRQSKWFFVEASPVSRITDTAPEKTTITWPLLWYNTLLSPTTSIIGSYEQGWKRHFELTEDELQLYKAYKLYGLRRPLWVIPEDYKHSRQGNDLLLQFTLPKSCYASVLIDLVIESKK